ncbi:MAG: DUF1501 domain-containing protein [Planctomycetia bacterium]|nr:DUF1501 domain-containing protein [Planctomycetia bacterium]
MLELTGRSWPSAGGLARRSFLKIGSVGLGAAGIGGLALPDLMAHRASAAAGSGKSAKNDTAVILFWMAGGPSQNDTFDPKPDASEIVRGPFKTIDTAVPGMRFSDQLPHLAKVADRLSVVRSIHHTHAVHDDASHWVQTGSPLLFAREQGQKQPAQGAVVSKLRGSCKEGVPPYVCIPEAYSSRRGFYQNAAFLGARHNPVAGGGDPKYGQYKLPEFSLPADLTFERIGDRRALSDSLNALSRQVDRHPAVAALDDTRSQAYDLVSGAAAREAFDLSREPDTLRDRYGRHFWGQSALLARRLVEAGVTFVTINLYEAEVDWWDDHSVIETGLRKRLPRFDQSLAALIADLQDRGLAERVLVGAFGEFGRSPKVDAKGGRGHWPGAMSAVLSGGGLRSGQVVGSTTADGGAPKDRPLSPGDLAATMYRVLGIDHEQFIHDAQNRPHRVLEQGKPIGELFG